MGNISTTRRNVIGALALAPMAAALPVRAALGASISGDIAMNMHTTISTGNAETLRNAWGRAFAARNAAKRAYDDHHEHVWLPLDAELDRIAPRPELSFEVTAKSGQTARYNVWPAKLHEWDDHISPVFREKAAAVREAWLSHLATQKRLGWDIATDESERLCNEQCEREGDLIRLPAPDLAALKWKMDHLFGPDARDPDDYSPSWCPEWINAVMADAKRLLIEGPTGADRERISDR